MTNTVGCSAACDKALALVERADVLTKRLKFSKNNPAAVPRALAAIAAATATVKVVQEMNLTLASVSA